MSLMVSGIVMPKVEDERYAPSVSSLVLLSFWLMPSMTPSKEILRVGGFVSRLSSGSSPAVVSDVFGLVALDFLRLYNEQEFEALEQLVQLTDCITQAQNFFFLLRIFVAEQAPALFPPRASITNAASNERHHQRTHSLSACLKRRQRADSRASPKSSRSLTHSLTLSLFIVHCSL